MLSSNGLHPYRLPDNKLYTFFAATDAWSCKPDGEEEPDDFGTTFAFRLRKKESESQQHESFKSLNKKNELKIYTQKFLIKNNSLPA